MKRSSKLNAWAALFAVLGAGVALGFEGNPFHPVPVVMFIVFWLLAVGFFAKGVQVEMRGR